MSERPSVLRAARRRLNDASRESLPAGLESVPDAVARHFVNLGGYEIAVFLRRLVPPGGRALIVGVGTGRDWWYLGLENETIALDVVEQSTVPDVVIADFSQALPFPDEHFEAVVISDVLEHVFDDLTALRNCRRVLSESGCLVLNVPYGDDVGDHHVRVYTRATVHRLLAAAGFRVVTEVERGPFAWLARYRAWGVLFHGLHAVRLALTGRPGYERTLSRLTAIDWWIGSRRIAPTRFSKRHGAYIKAVKDATERDFVEVNRQWYADQGERQLGGSRMRVLLVGERYPDSFADNIAVALEDAGHVVAVVAPYRRPLAGGGWVRSRLKAELPSQPRAAIRAQSHVLDAADAERPELILNVDFRLSWTIVRELAQRDCACAFWFPDSMGNLGRETHVLGHYDAIFIKDSAVARHYRDVLGLNAHFLAEACNPRWHTPPEGVSPGDAGASVLVVGNMYASRFALLRRLQAAGVELSVHGPPWPRWLPNDQRLAAAYTGRYLVRDEKARAFRGAVTVLNAMASHEADGANCRLFEASGCGAVVLTDWRDRLPSLFDVPQQVRAFRSFDELVGELRTIAGMSLAERRALGDAAAARAHAEHSYARRFETLTGLLGRG